MGRTYAFSFCCLPRHLARPANEHNSHRFGEWNRISSVNFQQSISGIHNFPVDRRLTAAQFSVGSLTCSEIRKFAELYGIHLRRWSPPLRERLRRRWRWDQLLFITEWSCGASRSWLWQMADQPHGFICYLAHGMAGGSQHKVTNADDKSLAGAARTGSQSICSKQLFPQIPCALTWITAGKRAGHHCCKRICLKMTTTLRRHHNNSFPGRNNENQNLLPQQQQPDSVPLNTATTNSHRAVKSYIYYLLHLNERWAPCAIAKSKCWYTLERTI